MLWGALTLAAGLAGWAGAAAGLRLRSSRLAVSVHACGMALAFGGCGKALTAASERFGTDGSYAEALLFCADILALFIAPFCVGSAVFTTLFLRRPYIAGAVGILLLLLPLLIPAFESDGFMILFTAGVSAALVAPTFLIHRHIRAIPAEQVRDRFLATAGWTVINSLLVLICGLQAEQMIDQMFDQD